MDFNPVLNPVFEWEYGYYAACRYLRYLNNAQRHDSVLCSFTWFQCSFELPGARVSFQVLYASQLTVLEQKKTIKKRIKLTYLCCKIILLVVPPHATTTYPHWAKDTSKLYWWSFLLNTGLWGHGGAIVEPKQYMYRMFVMQCPIFFYQGKRPVRYIKRKMMSLWVVFIVTVSGET